MMPDLHSCSICLSSPAPANYCGFTTPTIEVFPKNPKDSVDVSVHLTPLKFCP